MLGDRSVATLALALGIAGAGNAVADRCSGHVRVLNAALPFASTVDVEVNGRDGMPLEFRQVSDYVSVPPGETRIVFRSRTDGSVIAERQFVVGANLFYTVAATGPVKGPAGGPTLANETPFVFLDDMTPPNPGRWKGRWYRLSETNVAIDFRAFRPERPEADFFRLKSKPNKASYDFPDSPAGVFSFRPALIGSRDPLVNEAFTPPVTVEVAELEVPEGSQVSVFATGNALGVAPHSLLVHAVLSKAKINADGCLVPDRR
jgi:hypothetical protein